MLGRLFRSLKQKSPVMGDSDGGMLNVSQEAADDPVDDREGKHADNKTNDAIEDGILSLLDFASITRGGHVGDTANNNDDNGDNAEDKNDVVDDLLNIGSKIV